MESVEQRGALGLTPHIKAFMNSCLMWRNRGTDKHAVFQTRSGTKKTCQRHVSFVHSLQMWGGSQPPPKEGGLGLGLEE
ncbi:hypothetical protein EYF80_056910 [Liparis tanakae]|uniref:Uncharacterized protein n=1 Tax=Liparis tanakae TaxID=230148 RepID=A0A4Z2EVL0_9TELE|nr:hypothetical protein EYF80_056910 [Liparis tanakae]